MPRFEWMRHPTFRLKVVLIVSISALLLLVASIALLFIPMVDNTLDSYTINLEKDMQDIALLTQSLFSGLQEMPARLYESSSFLEMLRRGTDYDTNTRAQFNDLAMKLSIDFSNRTYLSSIRFFFINDALCLSINQRGASWGLSSHDADDLLEAYEHSTLLHEIRSLQRFESYDPSKPIFSYVQYFEDFPHYSLAGVYEADVTEALFNDFFSPRITLPDETLCILDSRHELLYCYGSLGIKPENYNALLDSLDFSNERVQQFPLENQPYLACVFHLTNPDSYILRFIPMNTLLQDARAILRHMILIYGTLALAIICFTLMLLHAALKPIDSLSRHMRHIEKGRAIERIHNIPSDLEFRALALQYNAMCDKLNHLINYTYKMQLLQKTTELKALQSQINPHFLFNTLQSIDYFALKHNAYEINIITDSLGKIMRYSMDNSTSSVPLCQEIEIVRQYLSIQQIHFIDKLSASIDISPATSNTIIPRMLIQPLVENCIRHGMRGIVHPLNIHLSAQKSGEDVVIRLSDNGRGIDGETLEKMHKSMEETDMLDIRINEHIGILNSFMRLRLLYDDAAAFSIDSTPQEGTTIQIVIKGGQLPPESRTSAPSMPEQK